MMKLGAVLLVLWMAIPAICGPAFSEETPYLKTLFGRLQRLEGQQVELEKEILVGLWRFEEKGRKLALLNRRLGHLLVRAEDLRLRILIEGGKVHQPEDSLPHWIKSNRGGLALLLRKTWQAGVNLSPDPLIEETLEALIKTLKQKGY